MPAEIAQEDGREGVFRAKRWLDATTKVRISWTVYESAPQVRIRRPDNSTQHFDLRGEMYLGGPPKPLLVECKNYNTAGDQKSLYRDYLADCYFATIDNGDDAEVQFMWVTWHPFDQGTWPNLCGPSDTTTAEGQAALDVTTKLIAEAVEGSGHLGDLTVDQNLCRVVAQRLWLVVLHERQETYLTLSEEVISHFRDGMLIAAKA